MEQNRIMGRKWQLWKVVHLISITMETQIPCSTPEKRTVTFEELDLEIPHDKVENKEEKKKNYIVRRARRQEPLIFIL